MARRWAQIQRQISKLQREASALRKKEVGGVIERIKTAIAHYELVVYDLFGTKTGGSMPFRVEFDIKPNG